MKMNASKRSHHSVYFCGEKRKENFYMLAIFKICIHFIVSYVRDMTKLKIHNGSLVSVSNYKHVQNQCNNYTVFGV